MYVWGVNSTVTKHSEYFVWKDTSKCGTWRDDDTVDKKRVNIFVLKHLLKRAEQPKKSLKNPGNAHSDALLMAAPAKKTTLRAVLNNELIIQLIRT